jgi:IMP dehydrogenase
MKLIDGLSYDDILLKPGYTEVVPHQTDITARLGGDIKLNVPIISAAMDTVTEMELAIALALQGGAGVIHRNLSPQAQAEQVSKVKRYLNWIIEQPFTIYEDQTIAEAQQIMRSHGISGLPVLNRAGTLSGILTSRDLRFCRELPQKVSQVMTHEVITETESVTVQSAKEKFDTHKIEKLPVINSAHQLIGLITVKDLEKQAQYPKAATDSWGRLIVGAAISPFDFRQRLPLLIEKKVDFVAIDVAHGNTESVVRATEQIKKEFDVILISGNVIDAEGTKRLISAGADVVKVGVGPGASCTTRIVAGVGVPQFTAVYESAQAAKKYKVPIVADGGIKYSGDIVKAVAAGADTVMIGGLFAGLKEAPGREILFDGRIFKEYRGMGSLAAIKEGSGDRYQMTDSDEVVPEGIEGRVPYKGELKKYLYQLTTGLRKGMAYCGCKTIADLQNYQQFIKITAAGLKESHPHDVIMTQEAPNYSGRGH